MYNDNEIMERNISNTIIKYSYRVLLTRGIKGCYVYCLDKDLNQFFKNNIELYK